MERLTDFKISDFKSLARFHGDFKEPVQDFSGVMAPSGGTNVR